MKYVCIFIIVVGIFLLFSDVYSKEGYTNKATQYSTAAQGGTVGITKAAVSSNKSMGGYGSNGISKKGYDGNGRAILDYNENGVPIVGYQGNSPILGTPAPAPATNIPQLGPVGEITGFNTDGTPKYPKDTTLGCPPSAIFTDPAKSPPPPDNQNGVQASQGATIQPLIDCSQAGNSVALTRDCFLQAVKNNGCSDDGTLYQSLQLANGGDSRWDGYLGNQRAFQTYQSRQGANSITDSLFKKNAGKWETAIADVMRIQTAMTQSSDPYVKVSAKDLCVQSGFFDSYDFCQDIADTTDIQSVDSQCIKNYWQENSGKPAGTAYPSSKKFDSVLGIIRTWLDYKTAVATLKLNTTSSDPTLQRKSMNAFYGVRVGTQAFTPKTVNSSTLEPTPPCYEYGQPSADKSVRLYSQNECTNQLDGNYMTDGQCYKKTGGSYSWDCRYLNAADSSNTLVLWLDANDGSTLVIDGRGGVKSWNDKSGKGNNISQMDVGSRPTYTSSTLPYINFNGSAFLPLPNAFNLVKGFFTIFIVEQRTSAKDYNCLLGGTQGGTNLNLVVGYRHDRDVMMAFYGNDLDINPGCEAFKQGSEPQRIWCLHFSSSGRAIYINGTKVGSDKNTSPLINWEGGMIGNFAGNFYTGNISEVLFYNTALDSDAKRQKVEGYLANKWGLQGNLDTKHPYKFVSP